MSVEIQINNITCTYDAEPILDGLTLDIKPGEILGIIGPNGSGKSTLLKSILAQLKLEQGHIYIDSKDLEQWNTKELARKLAVVPQESVMPFAFTVMEVVLMGRHPHLSFFENEGEHDYQIAERAMKATNTWHLRDRNVQALSGGERQRVILARALTQEPKIILLDEPISNLDIHHQVEVLNLIRQRNEDENLTSVCVLHDLNLAASHCDRLALLYQGKIYAFGTPQEVLTKKNIGEVYDCNPVIMNHPVTGIPQVIMINTAKINRTGNGKKLHIIAGGGKGAALMELLVSSGYQVSSGILNIGDTDWQVANSLGIPVIEEEPFAPISENAITEQRKMLELADVLVISDTPIGLGNLANLSLLEEYLRQGKPVVIISGEKIRERDYTEGKATAIVQKLFQLGLRDARNLKQLSQMLDLIKV
ncbi:heme ABC transporter ATP-binding protein [Desulfuribacillus alkaliarsenatis]|uniref:ABC transporter domain-containing protein n=1 Tax=Desulfuribacillus alkaliarsenatis TaxID=766136 RepID=A0A1E5G4G5_9FIRM|nr:heme ABC transporter ATP-binding protein [Desulfuribacillus alkaliarsenatis]OEF97982.1 hypothetical protein BHF68_13010 [Desulfuribacillus alkaliarsenatis]